MNLPKHEEKILKYWHLQYVRSHLDLPDATTEPTQAAAADSAFDDAARLQKLMLHVTDVCSTITDTILQSMSTCDIFQAPCQTLQIRQEVVSLFQTRSSHALQAWANQAPANFSTLMGSLGLQGHACTSPTAAVSYAVHCRLPYWNEVYKEDELRRVISCRLCRSALQV